MKLKNNFAIKCDTLEQKKHIRQVLIDMGYEDDKEWNDEHIKEGNFIYWHVEKNNKLLIYNFGDLIGGVITYHDFCAMHDIEPTQPQPQPLDELIKNFQSEMNKRGFDVEIVFKPCNK